MNRLVKLAMYSNDYDENRQRIEVKGIAIVSPFNVSFIREEFNDRYFIQMNDGYIVTDKDGYKRLVKALVLLG